MKVDCHKLQWFQAKNSSCYEYIEDKDKDNI